MIKQPLDDIPSASYATSFDTASRKETRSLFKSMRKRDIFASLLSLFGSTFGIGSLGLPGKMADVGPALWFSLLGLAIFVNYITYDHMIYFADQLGLVNFVDLATIVGHRKTYITILCLFVASSFCRLLSAMSVFNSLIANVAAEFGAENIYLITKESLIWICIPSVVLFPILIKKKMKSLAITTFVSMASAFYFIFFLAYSYSTIEREEKPDTKSLDSWTKIPGVYGYLLAVTSCQSNIMAIYNELSTKTVPIMKKVLWIHHGLFVIFYAGIAFFGYAIFYDDERIVKFQILELFRGQKSVILLIANFLMIVTALNSFVFGFKPLKDTILKIIQGEPQPAESSQKKKEETDFDPLNLLLTLSLLCIFLTFSGIFTLNQIGVLQILTFSSNVVIPILFTFIPLFAAIKTRPSWIVYSTLGVAAFFYLWKLVDYAMLLLQ